MTVATHKAPVNNSHAKIRFSDSVTLISTLLLTYLLRRFSEVADIFYYYFSTFDNEFT